MSVLHIGHCMLCPVAEVQHYRRLPAMMHSSEEQFDFYECSSCGLVYLDPRLGPSELAEYYDAAYLPYRGADAWGAYAKRVAASMKAVDAKRVQWITRHTDLLPFDIIFDIGCGRPTFLQAAAQRFGCRSVGLDFSDHGWKDSAETYADLDLRVGEIDSLQLDKPPRVITAWHYLEHDYYPIETLSRLAALSDDETLLVIEVPDHDSDSRRKYGDSWAGYHVPRHTYLFDPKTIALTLERSGWEVLEIDRRGTLDPYNLHWMSGAEQRNIDWAASMEGEFMRYVRGMLAYRLRELFSPQRSSGVMTIAARIKSS